MVVALTSRCPTGVSRDKYAEIDIIIVANIANTVQTRLLVTRMLPLDLTLISLDVIYHSQLVTMTTIVTVRSDFDISGCHISFTVSHHDNYSHC